MYDYSNINYSINTNKVSNSDNTFCANTLDLAINFLLISKRLADKLNLCGREHSPNNNKYNCKIKIKSKLVNFSASSNFHPFGTEISHACFVDNLNLASYSVTKDFPHAHDIDLEQKSNKNISILISVNMLELHMQGDNRIGDKVQPGGILDYLGLGAYGWKIKTNLSDCKGSFNFLNRDAEMLNKSIDHVWQT